MNKNLETLKKAAYVLDEHMSIGNMPSMPEYLDYRHMLHGYISDCEEYEDISDDLLYELKIRLSLLSLLNKKIKSHKKTIENFKSDYFKKATDLLDILHLAICAEDRYVGELHRNEVLKGK